MDVVKVSLEAATEVTPGSGDFTVMIAFKALNSDVTLSIMACRRISFAVREGCWWACEFRAWRYDIDWGSGVSGIATSIAVRSNEVFVVVTFRDWSSMVKKLDSDAMLRVAYERSPDESSSACAVFPFPTLRATVHFARTVGSSGTIDS